MSHPLCQLPTPLTPGDHLGVILPSGALREPEALEAGLAVWRSRGYEIHDCSPWDHPWGYLAGTDAARRQSLAAALNHPQIRGILCGRGGYGSARLLEQWSWPLGEPKWLIGFSDITSLLWGLAVEGIASVHGPVLTTLAQEPAWSQQRLFDCVEGRPLSTVMGKGWGQGQVTGPLLPANLTVATHLLGTPLQPDLRGCILALEDVTEAPYRIDRMLTQWRLSGLLSQVGGIALGRFSQCDAPPPSFTVETVLRDRLADLGVPVVSELPFGHQGANAALPVGVMACLDGDRGTLSIQIQDS